MFLIIIFRNMDTIKSPWDVDNLQEFMYYCCPECQEKTKSKDNFLQHALCQHPQSQNYLQKFTVNITFVENVMYFTELANTSTSNVEINDDLEDTEDTFPENYLLEQQEQEENVPKKVPKSSPVKRKKNVLENIVQTLEIDGSEILTKNRTCKICNHTYCDSTR